MIRSFHDAYHAFPSRTADAFHRARLCVYRDHVESHFSFLWIARLAGACCFRITTRLVSFSFSRAYSSILVWNFVSVFIHNVFWAGFSYCRLKTNRYLWIRNWEASPAGLTTEFLARYRGMIAKQRTGYLYWPLISIVADTHISHFGHTRLSVISYPTLPSMYRTSVLRT